MRRVLRMGRPDASMVVAIIALVFAATGGAVASAGHPKATAAKKSSSDAKADNAQISSFFNSHKGSLRGPAGATGATGAQGPAGPAGAAGAPGANATALWALVRADGTTDRSSGVVSSHLNTNGSTTYQYNVKFNRNITGCAYVATASDPGGISPTTFTIPYIATTAYSSNDPNTVIVMMYYIDKVSSNYVVQPDDFSLAVFC
jgi:hypothetical protein